MQTMQNFCTTPGLLTAAGAETVYDTTVTISYVLAGVVRNKAAVTDGATPTTDIVTGSAITLTASKARSVVWCLDSGGTVRLIAGPIVAWDGGTGTACPLPSIPDAYVPFGVMVAKAASNAGTITIGSSNWNATGFTNAITNVAVLPARPPKT